MPFQTPTSPCAPPSLKSACVQPSRRPETLAGPCLSPSVSWAPGGRAQILSINGEYCMSGEHATQLLRAAEGDCILVVRPKKASVFGGKSAVRGLTDIKVPMGWGCACDAPPRHQTLHNPCATARAVPRSLFVVCTPRRPPPRPDARAQVGSEAEFAALAEKMALARQAAEAAEATAAKEEAEAAEARAAEVAAVAAATVAAAASAKEQQEAEEAKAAEAAAQAKADAATAAAAAAAERAAAAAAAQDAEAAKVAEVAAAVERGTGSQPCQMSLP